MRACSKAHTAVGPGSAVLFATLAAVLCLPMAADGSMHQSVRELSHPLSDYSRLGLTAEQKRKIFELSTANDAHIAVLSERVDNLRQEMGKLALQPDIDATKAFAIQDQINELQRQMDVSEVKTTLAIREVLTPEQRVSLVYGNASETLGGALLSDSQRAHYSELMREHKGFVLERQRKLAQLEFDQTLFYQDVELDEKAMLEKQAEINQVKDELANERIRLAVRTRAILSGDQRQEVFNRHHPQVWRESGIDKKQDDEIMGVHMKIEEADQSGRRRVLDLINDLARIYANPQPDTAAAFAKQEELDRAVAETSTEQLKLIISAREILSPKQKEKLVALMQLGRDIHPTLSMPLSDAASPGKSARAEFTTVRGISYVRLGGTVVEHLGDANLSVKNASVVVLKSGEIVARTQAVLHVELANTDAQIAVGPGAIALISAKDGALVCRTLFAPGARSVTLSLREKSIVIAPGEEVILGQDGAALDAAMKGHAAGRRKIQGTTIGAGQHIRTSEISLVSLLKSNQLLRKMKQEGTQEDRSATDKVMKLAASLMHAAPQHGPYGRSR